MAVSVPKRLFKNAVDRNLLKRRIREAYRLNKRELYSLLQQKERNLKLVIQYQHKEIKEFKTIEDALKMGLSKLAAKLDEQD
jgi:ribonuclease P protein component